MAASVKDYGAKGNGIADDTAAIQNAVNATKSGTLLFPAGTYRLSTTITLLNNVTYQGQGTAKLQGNGNFWIFRTQYNGVNDTIAGLTFDNGGLLLQGTVTGLTVQGNTFQNFTVDHTHGDWGQGNAIFAGSGGVRSSTFSGNTFKNLILPAANLNGDYNGNDAMHFFGLDSTSIDHNTFDHVNEAIKICFTNTYRSQDIYIGHNIFTGIHRMGMEIQGAQGCGAAKPVINGPDTYNMVIEYNSFTNPYHAYWWTYPISLANPAPYGGSGAIIRYNYLVSAVPDYGMSGPNGYGIEAASANMQIYGNTVVGPWGTGITYNGAPNSSLHDNWLCGLAQGATVGIRYETSQSTNVSIANNTIYAHHCPANIPNPIASAGAPTPPVTATTAAPVIAPAGTSFLSPLFVTISDATSGAVIHYTTDGSTPSANSPIYNGGITLTASATINAIAIAAGYNPSGIASATYTYTPPPPSSGGDGNAVVQQPSGGQTDLVSDGFIWTSDLPMSDENVSYGNHQMVINVPGKSNHDAFVGGNLAAKAFQNTANADFDVVAKFSSTPRGAYQGQGIMVEQDNRTYLRFEFSADGSGAINLFAGSIAAGKQTTHFNQAIDGLKSGPMWLEVQRAGNLWTTYYSTDGTNFIKAAQFTVTLKATKVGPYAWNYNATPANSPAMTAIVDEFRVN
jgi:hypothetical protein